MITSSPHPYHIFPTLSRSQRGNTAKSMSINDKDASVGPKGQDVVDGLRNFTSTGNPATEERDQQANRYDAWAASGQRGMGSGEPGVIEAEPGLVESSNIAPLDSNAGPTTASTTVGDSTTSTFDSIVGKAKQAYGAAVGDSSIEQAGKQQYGDA